MSSSAAERFFAYAAAFEKAYASDDWSRVEPYFHDDAVYDSGMGAPLGGRLEGRAAILAYFKRVLDRFDRRFESRELALLDGPRTTGDSVWIRGRATYRGQLKVAPGATNVVASVRCDALMLDDESRSDTYPYIDIQEDDTTMSHEATVGKVSADQVFYLMARGLTENEATNLIVQGFLEVFTKELPMEYAIEFNRLVKLEMEGSLG